eukprot:TRINITY_DN4676_c0_g1_i1.p1 TRINITY_DN4676_c0_g1~~TRINITY_DN4676_c0_g1_i1.p1  ORF type:complete len:362 (-),score=70.34 TRINITY_DN4676_c0_g1_i1:27-1112(-)
MPHTNNKWGRTNVYRDKQATRGDSGGSGPISSMFTDSLGSGPKTKDMKFTKRAPKPSGRGGAARGSMRGRGGAFRGGRDSGPREQMSRPPKKEKREQEQTQPLVKARDVNFDVFAQELKIGNKVWKAFKSDDSFCKLELKAILSKEPSYLRITINEKGDKNSKLRTTVNMADIVMKTAESQKNGTKRLFFILAAKPSFEKGVKSTVDDGSAVAWQACDSTDVSFLKDDSKTIELLVDDSFSPAYEQRLFGSSAAPAASAQSEEEENDGDDDNMDTVQKSGESDDGGDQKKRKRKRAKGRDDPSKRMPDVPIKKIDKFSPKKFDKGPKSSNQHQDRGGQGAKKQSFLQQKAKQKKFSKIGNM